MCISNISFQLVPRPSSGTQPENPDIPHTGPLLGAPYHSRLPDRSSTSHEQLEQSGIPVRFRSEYGRKDCIDVAESLLFYKIE